MKKLLRGLFSPILNIFESGDDVLQYKKSHRVILLVMGVLFSGLASSVVFFSPTESSDYLTPVFIFGSVGFVSLLVGALGTDQAVAKIWGSSKR